MIHRLIMKLNGKFETKDLKFFFVGTPDEYEIAKMTRNEMREILASEVVGVEVIRESEDKIECS